VSLEKESFEVRKFLIGALVAGSMAVTGALAMPAHAVSSCGTGPAVTPSGTGGTLTVGTPAGCLTASGDAAAQSGYVVADGASTNGNPGGGYIGVDGSDGGPTIVGCASGDYTPGGTNHVLASQAHPPSVPPATDSCTPSPAPPSAP
jgi:hypothetical protein